MRKKTVATLASELSFVNPTPLSKALKEFVRSKGLSKTQFIEADHDTITSLATSFTRKVGRKLWGVPGKFPNFPDNEDFIVRVVADLLALQQRYTIDSLRHKERRERDITSEEPDKSSGEERGEQEGEPVSGARDIQDHPETVNDIEQALEHRLSPEQPEQDTIRVTSMQEAHEIPSSSHNPLAREPLLTDHVSEQKTTETSCSPFITLYTKVPTTTCDSDRSSCLDAMSRYHKRRYDVMGASSDEMKPSSLSMDMETRSATRQKRAAIDRTESGSQAEGDSNAVDTLSVTHQRSDSVTPLGFSSVNSMFTYEPVLEEKVQPSAPVQMLESSTQTEGRLKFEIGFTRHSLDRANLEPLFLRTLDRYMTLEFEIRSRMCRDASADQVLQEKGRLDLIRQIISMLWKDLISLGAVGED